MLICKTFIPKGVYKIILTMKYEMEMVDEVKSHVEHLHDFYDEIKNLFIHHSFPSYHVFCFFTKEIDRFLPILNQIKHISLYQKDNKPWYYISSHKSGYQSKMLNFLKEHPDSDVNPLIKGYLLYQHEFQSNLNDRYKLIYAYKE